MLVHPQTKKTYAHHHLQVAKVKITNALQSDLILKAGFIFFLEKNELRDCFPCFNEHRGIR